MGRWFATAATVYSLLLGAPASAQVSLEVQSARSGPHFLRTTHETYGRLSNVSFIELYADGYFGKTTSTLDISGPVELVGQSVHIDDAADRWGAGIGVTGLVGSARSGVYVLPFWSDGRATIRMQTYAGISDTVDAFAFLEPRIDAGSRGDGYGEAQVWWHPLDTDGIRIGLTYNPAVSTTGTDVTMDHRAGVSVRFR